MSFARWAMVTVPAIMLLGFLSGRSVTSGEDSGWYMALTKPELTPPGWVFPVAWSLLYIMMGLALAMILSARGAPLRWLAAGLFAVQFAMNLVWTPLFFGAHKVDAAFLLTVAMLGVTIITTFVFARVRTIAAWLLVPYMVWISFAGVLTWRIGQLNPDAEHLVPAAVSSQILG